MSELITPPAGPPEPTFAPPPSPLPDPSKQGNRFGLIALILAAVGFLFAIIPATAGFAWLFTLPAVVLGIIGLTRKGAKKGTSIAAIVVSTVAWLIAVIVVLSSVLSGVNAAVQSQDSGGVVADESVEEEPAQDEPAVEEPAVEEPLVEEPVVEEPTEPALTLAQQNAVRSGESYLDFSGFSRSGLIDQLEYEGYTTEEATFAVDSIAPDWNAEAAQSAESYLEFSAFSRQELVDQLLYEGFTPQEAEFGVSAVGY